MYNKNFPLHVQKPHLFYFEGLHNISIKMQDAGIPLISSVILSIDQLVDTIDEFKDNINNHAVVRSVAI